MIKKLSIIATLIVCFNTSYSQDKKTYTYKYVFGIIMNQNDEITSAHPIGRNCNMEIDYFYKTINLHYDDELEGNQIYKLRYSFTNNKTPIFKQDSFENVMYSVIYTEKITTLVEYTDSNKKYGLLFTNEFLN